MTTPCQFLTAQCAKQTELVDRSVIMKRINQSLFQKASNQLFGWLWGIVLKKDINVVSKNITLSDFEKISSGQHIVINIQSRLREVDKKH